MQRETTTHSGSEPQTLSAVSRALLLCGIIYALFYVSTDILAAIRWDAYSYTSQSVSELSAIGAPTRPLLVAAHSLDTLLVIAFGIGVFGSAGRKRTLRVTGVLLALYGATAYLGLLLFPMHLRGHLTDSDTMHLVQQSVVVLLILLFIGFGAAAIGKGFRLFSVGTILAMLAAGALASTQAPLVAAELPTPWLGVIERVSVYSPMLWMLVLAVVLLRTSNETAPK